MVKLTLKAADFEHPRRWRWVLLNSEGSFLGEHQVDLSHSREYLAFGDLYEHLKYACSPDHRQMDEVRILKELGEWAGEALFGPLVAIIISETPAVVQVLIPASRVDSAESIFYLPLELAYAGGRALAEQDVSFVFRHESDKHRTTVEPVGNRLRFLAVFSLPEGESALNLRRERHELMRLMHEIAGTRRLAIDVRMLQYGATRDSLEAALQEGEGWDVIHLSGHGAAGELVLETADGEADPLSSADLVKLLWPARSRLKWVTISACSSAAAEIAETLQWLHLTPNRSFELKDTASYDRVAHTALARATAAEFDCAVLAMRFPVDDDFAIRLAELVYRGVFEQGNTLERALQIALSRIAKIEHAPLSIVTPTLFGARSVGLSLAIPLRAAEAASTIRMAHFPAASEHFVGRVATLAQASQVLSPRSREALILLYGMAGGGKTACALELAFHYEGLRRFTYFVWFRAPEFGQDTSQALLSFTLQWELQVRGENDQPLLPLAHLLRGPADFVTQLPRLKQFLRDNSILLFLDNLESLLLEDGSWREELWAMLMAVLTEHTGLSRTIVTSRIAPRFSGHAGVFSRPIHALSLDEAALLMRQLPNLGTLFHTEDGRQLVTAVLKVVQGHPKLIEFTEALAAEPHRLRVHVEHALKAEAIEALPLHAFFDTGESQFGAEQFMLTLENWISAIIGNLSLDAQCLFSLLCCLEENDRNGVVLDGIWARVWTHNNQSSQAPGYDAALGQLREVALIEQSPTKIAIGIHPGVSELGRRQASSDFRMVVDNAAGRFWAMTLHEGRETRDSGLVVLGGISAAPYLIRSGEWMAAASILDHVQIRDTSPVTLATILPLLNTIARMTAGGPHALQAEGILARTLFHLGMTKEAETSLRGVIKASVDAENFAVALPAAHDLYIILRDTGRFAEAFALISEAEEYSKRAGTGHQDRIRIDGQRLQMLVLLGRYEEVLERALRWQKVLTEPSEDSSSLEARPDAWSVILAAGFAAASALERWEMALKLNEHILAIQEIGTPPLELAKIEIARVEPLIAMRRFADARRLLNHAREIFEASDAIIELGLLFSSLAHLEHEMGNMADAVRHQETALRYHYLVPRPHVCAACHANLAVYLVKAKAQPSHVLSHRLAYAMVGLRTANRLPDGVLPDLASDIARVFSSSPSDGALDFSTICAIVEKIEGVRFRELWAGLPQRQSTTDEQWFEVTLAEVLKFIESRAQP